MTKRRQDLIDRLAQEARKGRVSRREFMHHSIVAGVTAATAAGLWTSKVAAQTPSVLSQ